MGEIHEDGCGVTGERWGGCDSWDGCIHGAGTDDIACGCLRTSVAPGI